jgi:hypothetical protein
MKLAGGLVFFSSFRSMTKQSRSVTAGVDEVKSGEKIYGIFPAVFSQDQGIHASHFKSISVDFG